MRIKPFSRARTVREIDNSVAARTGRHPASLKGIINHGRSVLSTMARTSKESPREEGMRAGISSWLERAQHEADMADEQLATTSKARNELAGHRIGATKASAMKAFAYGELLGQRLPFVSGITGLYAAGYIADTIYLLNEAFEEIGPGPTLATLATLPHIVDTEFALSSDHAKDISVARAIAEMVFRRYAAPMRAAWESPTRIRRRFQKGSDYIDDALHLCYKMARSLEQSGNHEPRDVRGLCFPRILASTRGHELELTEFEKLYEAADMHANLHAYHLPLKLNLEWIEHTIEYGNRLRLNFQYSERFVDIVDAGPRVVVPPPWRRD